MPTPKGFTSNSNPFKGTFRGNLTPARVPGDGAADERGTEEGLLRKVLAQLLLVRHDPLQHDPRVILLAPHIHSLSANRIPSPCSCHPARTRSPSGFSRSTP
eukprot:3467436-Rhodomonas_salina.1